MKNNYSVYIDNSIFSPLSNYPRCSAADHYFITDPVSGVNVWYPVTAFGGPLSANGAYQNAIATIPGFITSAYGGPMEDVCYQDYCYSTTIVNPIKTFCISTIAFVLTGFDQSTGNVIKIIYDFNDGTLQSQEEYDYTTNVSPISVIKYHTFYPKLDFISTFYPVISVIKQDCCVCTFKFTISVFRCGIYDSYANVRLLDASVSKNAENVLLTLEQPVEKQIFRNLLKTLTKSATALENTDDPVPVITDVASTTATIVLNTDFNPIKPPIPIYTYTPDESILLEPSPSILVKGEDFGSEDESVLVSLSAPYYGVSGIRVRGVF